MSQIWLKRLLHIASCDESVAQYITERRTLASNIRALRQLLLCIGVRCNLFSVLVCNFAMFSTGDVGFAVLVSMGMLGELDYSCLPVS